MEHNTDIAENIIIYNVIRSLVSKVLRITCRRERTQIGNQILRVITERLVFSVCDVCDIADNVVFIIAIAQLLNREGCRDIFAEFLILVRFDVEITLGAVRVTDFHCVRPECLLLVVSQRPAHVQCDRCHADSLADHLLRDVAGIGLVCSHIVVIEAQIPALV